MKKAWQTTEFWTHVITNLVGFAVIFGAVNAEEGAELSKALTAIAGAVLSIASTLGYMKARVEVKKARCEALSSYNFGGKEGDGADVEMAKRDHMVKALKNIGV